MNHEDTKAQRGKLPSEVERAAKAVVNAAYAVHSALGPGLLESIYELCLARELELRGVAVERQIPVPITYADLVFKEGLRIDLLVEKCLVVEIKAMESLLPVHRAQVLTYLKLTGLRLGLLVNFNVPLIKDGIQRIIL